MEQTVRTVGGNVGRRCRFKTNRKTTSRMRTCGSGLGQEGDDEKRKMVKAGLGAAGDGVARLVNTLFFTT